MSGSAASDAWTKMLDERAEWRNGLCSASSCSDSECSEMAYGDVWGGPRRDVAEDAAEVTMFCLIMVVWSEEKEERASPAGHSSHSDPSRGT